MRLKLLVLVLLPASCGLADLQAQQRFRYFSIAATNSASSYPVSGVPQLWKAGIHPGLTLGTGFNWKQFGNISWAQTFKIGFFRHRFIQNAVMLYTENGLRHAADKWGISAMLGAGYLHSFVATDRFKQNTDGVYQSYGKWGRPQAMFGFTLGIDRSVGNGCRVFTRVQTILQTPFVQGYIPILPINQLHFGMTIPLIKHQP